MKHLAKLILLCLLSISLAIYSQDYYWYKDRKIFLQQGNQCYILYHNNYSKDESLLQIIEEGNASIHKDNDLKWAIITQPQPTRLSNVVYQCSSFLCSDTAKNIFATHRFCVKLRRRNDLAILQDFANRYHAEFEYTDALPLWYILRCGENSKYNALELANIFYESGLFAACEPEFLNTININCVNDSHFDYQWNLKNTGQYGSSYSGIDINYCDAHSITTGNSSVIIGVYDLGIDLVHPDINIHSFSYDAALQSSPSHIYSINIMSQPLRD